MSRTLPSVIGILVLAAVVATAAWLSFRPAAGPPVRQLEADGNGDPMPAPDDGSGAVDPPAAVPASRLARVPEPEDLTLRTIEMLVVEKESERAIRALAPHLAKDEPEPKAFRLRGRALLDLGSWRRAEKDFGRALEGEGDDPSVDALDGRAEALIQLRRTEEARKLLDRSAELEPDRARVHALRALSYLKDRDPAAARKEIDAALLIDPSDSLAIGLQKRIDNAPR